jgi:hypothetical protein
MSILEILSFRSVLQMLLQAVAALVAADWGNGCLIDNNSTVLRCHDGFVGVSG